MKVRMQIADVYEIANIFVSFAHSAASEQTVHIITNHITI